MNSSLAQKVYLGRDGNLHDLLDIPDDESFEALTEPEMYLDSQPSWLLNTVTMSVLGFILGAGLTSLYLIVELYFS